MKLQRDLPFVQTLLTIICASMWSSYVQCRTLENLNEVTKSEGTDTDIDWPVLCPEETFYDKSKEECTKCSQCPINQMITSPCHGLMDTQCGPFESFNFFESPKTDVLVVEDGDNSNQTSRFGNGHRPSSNRSNTIITERESASLNRILVIILVIVSTILVLLIAITCHVRHKTSRVITKEALCDYQAALVEPVEAL